MSGTPTAPPRPPYSAQPSPPPPTTTRRPSGGIPRWLWLILGVAVAATILAVILIVVFGGRLIATTAGPSIAADRYYSAIKNRDYTNAYSHLGSALQANMTQQEFTQQARAHDADEGNVVDFAYRSVPLGDPADLTIDVTRAHGDITTVHLRLQQENGVWKVTSFDGI